MAFFQYRAADQAGKVVEGVMEADAERSVVLRLREMGCVPLRIAVPSERAIGAPRQQRPPLCELFFHPEADVAVADRATIPVELPGRAVSPLQSTCRRNE